MPTNANRPPRIQVQDETGRPRTLPCGPEDFAHLCGQGPQTVLLGLGPAQGTALLAALLAAPDAALFVECPELAAQYGPDWRAGIPAGLREIPPAEIPGLARAGAKILLYTPGLRAFPSFWGPLLARVQTALFANAPAPRPRLAWLPGGERDLMRVELKEAFEEIGWRAECLGEVGPEDIRARLAAGECPSLFLSVNFSGLDPLGEAFHLLSAAGARVAAWCVDNPLHLISGLRSRFWARLPLFVTDDWFLPVLAGLGAQDVRHLPLAARASDFSRSIAPAPDMAHDMNGRLLFVGRSSFPDKAGFFAGCALPEGHWGDAEAMLTRGQRPDFGWWLERLGITRLWPDKEVRAAGFCAEETGKAWRALCLTRAFEALGPGLCVVGDEGWRELLPAGADIRPPVDYYGALPGLTAGAACCLNCTSPLLPRGLTQRHFDVWAWGGVLLTDATPGLALFPDELTRPVTFRAPEEIPGLFRRLAQDGELRRQLTEGWREHVRHGHTYARRLFQVLEHVDLAG